MKSLPDFIRAYGHSLTPHQDSMQAKRDFAVPVVISREYGSGGLEFATRMAENLGYQLCDRNILEQISARAHAPEELVRMLDEKPARTLETFGTSLLRQSGLQASDYAPLLKATLKAFLTLGKVVILGRGAVFAAEPHKSFRLKLVADLPVRVARIMSRFEISESEAKAQLQQVENERRKFLQKLFGHSEADDDLFDLVINTGTYSMDDAFDLAMSAYQKLAGRPAVVR